MLSVFFFYVQEAFRITGIHPFSLSIMSSLKQTLRKESTEPERPAHENCLVEMGIIPAFLAEILVPPPSKPSNNKGKITGARLITATEPQSSTSNEIPNQSSKSRKLYEGSSIKEQQPSSSSEKCTSSRSDKQSACSVSEVSEEVFIDEHPDNGICVVCMTNQRLEWIPSKHSL